MNNNAGLHTSDAGFSISVPNSSCTEGCFLAAQYSEDELWCRCLVQQVNEASELVRFIDYENCDVVPLNKLRFLDPEFAKLLKVYHAHLLLSLPWGLTGLTMPLINFLSWW